MLLLYRIYVLENRAIEEVESQYNCLSILDNEGSVGVSTNLLMGVQSIFLEDSSKLTGYYYDYLLSVPMFKKYINMLEENEVIAMNVAFGNSVDSTLVKSLSETLKHSVEQVYCF